jgi:hypothetical protein
MSCLEAILLPPHCMALFTEGWQHNQRCGAAHHADDPVHELAHTVCKYTVQLHIILQYPAH